jgi:hypothetical protein
MRGLLRAFLVSVMVIVALAMLADQMAQGAQGPALTITPGQVEGTAGPGQSTGPITISNTTGRAYSVTVLPVLVGQRSDGGLFVRTQAAPRALAGRLLRVAGRTNFPLPNGAARTVSARLHSSSPEDNYYGGLLFRATPTGVAQDSQIGAVLQLNARVFLRPPPPLRRPAGALLQLHGESGRKRTLRLVARVANRGNVDFRPSGTVRVRDSAGRVRFSGRLGSVDLLPGYDMDLRVDLGGVVLPAGPYTLEALVRAGGKLLRKRTNVRLLGPNELATRRARLVKFEPPRATSGAEVKVSATYRNTGNVQLDPRVELSVSGLKESLVLDTEPVRPATEGKATGTLRLNGTRSRDLTARLLIGKERLDTRTVTVTPVPRGSVMNRVSDWIVRRAVWLVLVLAVLLLLTAGALVRLATAVSQP